MSGALEQSSRSVPLAAAVAAALFRALGAGDEVVADGGDAAGAGDVELAVDVAAGGAFALAGDAELSLDGSSGELALAAAEVGRFGSEYGARAGRALGDEIAGSADLSGVVGGIAGRGDACERRCEQVDVQVLHGSTRSRGWW